MDRRDDTDRESLYEGIAAKVYHDLCRGEYALLGVYLPDAVLRRVAVLCGETDNHFVFSPDGARLCLESALLSRVLDDVRDLWRPNRRWCVLVRNVVHIFETCRGSLGGADLSGLDLSECDLSEAILSSGGLSARLDGSVLAFDSFLSYRLPGLRIGEEAILALEARRGQILLAGGGCVLHLDPAAPERPRLLCALGPLLEEGEEICKLRLSEDGRCLLLTLSRDPAAFDEATSLRGDGALPPCRYVLFDGRNLIACHTERELAAGAVLRRFGGVERAFLEGRELARFRERHCWELESGDPLRDELSAKDRLSSGDLRYKLENGRVTERGSFRSLAHIYVSPGRAGAPLCRVNPTAAGCRLELLHPTSRVTPEQLLLLKGKGGDRA